MNNQSQRQSRIIALVLVAVMVLSLPAAAAGAAGESPSTSGGESLTEVNSTAAQSTNSTNLTVLMYNDIQTAASDPHAMGRLVGTIQERESALAHPTVVVGGGDQVSPSSLSPLNNWTTPIEALNVLEPDAEVIGNHDLDYGFEPVEEFAAASEFPWLVSNLQQTDGGDLAGTEEYRIVERDGVSIGIIGLVDEKIYSKTAVDFEEEGYEVTDYLETGSALAEDLKTEQDVDVVVAAAHIGVPNSETLAQESDDIDVIVVGDDERYYEPNVVNDTAIVEAEARGAYVGEVNLTVDDSGATFDDGRLIEVTEDSPSNETAETAVADAREEYLTEVIGETETPLDSTFGSNYAEDTRWGNVVTDAFLDRTGADVALTNAGGIRGDFIIEEGEITYDDVYTSLPFDNYLVTKEMTGEQLEQLLDSQAVSLDDQYGAQASLQAGGVTYEFVDRPDEEWSIDDVYVGSEPLDTNATYEVALNSYMAGWTFEDRYGWDMEDLETVDEDFTLYGTATAEYIEENSPLSPPGEDRIRRVTRTASQEDVALTGETLTVSYDLPDAVTDVNASTVQVKNLTHGAVDATDVELDTDTMHVEFDISEYESLFDASDELQVYADYADAEFDDQRNAYDRSRLDAELTPVSDPVPVIAGADNNISTANLQTALEYWATGEVVPGTNETMSTETLRVLVEYWRSGGSLDTETNEDEGLDSLASTAIEQSTVQAPA